MKDTSKRAHEPWKAFQARQRNQDIKRDAVLQTAAHMFLEQGYRRTSMSELAKRLQITKPALYYYFRNKEELLVECYRAGITLIEILLDKALVSQGTGLDKVKVYIEAYAKSVVLHDFGRCVSMLDENELSSETRKLVRALKRRIDASIRGYIEEGIADKSIALAMPSWPLSPCQAQSTGSEPGTNLPALSAGWRSPATSLISSRKDFVTAPQPNADAARPRQRPSRIRANPLRPAPRKHRVDFLTLRSVFFSSGPEQPLFFPSNVMLFPARRSSLPAKEITCNICRSATPDSIRESNDWNNKDERVNPCAY